MGRDIEFAHNYFDYCDYHFKARKHGYVGRASESHRTRLKSGEGYEDYGTFLWLNKDGGIKKKNKFGNTILEGTTYEPRDYYKYWEVPVWVGDYIVTFSCYLNGTSLHLYELKGVDCFSDINGKIIRCKTREKLIGKIEYWGKDEENCYYTYENGDEHYNLKGHNRITSEMIRRVFKKKFWKALDEIIEIPDFPVQEGYDRYYRYGEYC